MKIFTSYVQANHGTYQIGNITKLPRGSVTSPIKKTSWGWTGPSSVQLQTRSVSLTYCSCHCAKMYLMPLDDTWRHLMPIDATWCHMMSLDSTWYRLITWYRLMPLDSTWCHLMPVDATWFHLIPLDVSWCQLMPLDFTWYHLMPLSVGSLLNETKCHLVSFSLVANQTKWHLVWSFPN